MPNSMTEMSTDEKLFPLTLTEDGVTRVSLLTKDGDSVVQIVKRFEPYANENTVLAENISVVPEPSLPGKWNLEFDWLCPNCGERHWARELWCSRLISYVNYGLDCGEVKVRFPWARTQARQQKSVYGQERV